MYLELVHEQNFSVALSLPVNQQQSQTGVLWNKAFIIIGVPHSVSLWQHGPLVIMGYDSAIRTHRPILNPLGPITRWWWQSASWSRAAAARPLLCTLLPRWFFSFDKIYNTLSTQNLKSQQENIAIKPEHTKWISIVFLLYCGEGCCGRQDTNWLETCQKSAVECWSV